MANRASTPPPTSTIHTPPTPKHGWGDKYEPYSPRKSARVSARQLQRDARTPPPQPSHYGLGTHRASPPTTIKRASANMPASPPSVAAKRRTPPTRGSKRLNILSDDTAASNSAPSGLQSRKSEVKESRSSISTRNHGMLPTPDKTPRKRSTQATTDISAIARNLFPVRPETIDEVMPSPRKSKKYSGYTLDSFTATEDPPAPIQIYTDSQDRIPEVDTSTDNPFYGAVAATPASTRRTSKRRKITIPGEGEQTVEDAEKRTDGIIYVFRGKKIFRKFAEEDGASSSQRLFDASEDELDEELDATVPTRIRGPLTRSSIKPRLLFPTAEQSARKKEMTAALDDEEEAVTDIDESHDLTTPNNLVEKAATTPKAPKYAPASPPTTVRTTRSRKIEFTSPGVDGSDDSALSGSGKVSPFDGWKQRKVGISSEGKKRGGDPITRGGGDLTKRQRGGQIAE